MKLYFLKINKKDINSIYNLGKNNLQIYYDKNDINYSIISDDFASFKVEYNNNIVAFVICQKMNIDRLHINSIAVDKKYRRLGIGNFIIKKIKYMFKYKFITLYVSVKNINALKLYFKNNFKIINIKKNYYYSLNEDAYFMYYNKNNILYYNLNNIIYNLIILFFILYNIYLIYNINNYI